ncbi:MAG: pyridoxine 5'-phosphate synthase [Deltaproteobacteria bacterium]|nr:pyridoxine 5'-phosphate synthase [Deltaproteobacteria bacterium]
MSDKPVLHVNVDHIATIRQARGTNEPDPVYAALQAEQAGAEGITVHLREDRRHIQDRDLRLMREMILTRLNLEMASTGEMLEIAKKVKPDMVTLVPEKRREITTEGGLDLSANFEDLKKTIGPLKERGIRVSLFIDPDQKQIEQALKLEADDIELHTGEYANQKDPKLVKAQLKRLKIAAKFGHELKLKINAGHGLTYVNIGPVLGLPHLRELNIGHSIIARSVYTGIYQAVREMRALIREGV